MLAMEQQQQQRVPERFAIELDDAERELWRQLRRKRDFEERLAEKRAQLAELRDKRRSSSVAHASMAASVERLTCEVEATRNESRQLEHDIAVLTESNRILQGVFEVPPARTKNSTDAPVQEAAEVELPHAGSEDLDSVQLLHAQIEHLRGHLNRLLAEKTTLQQRQQVLFEKQRSAEQDRNRLLSSLQDDRKSINDVRSERIKLWEERCEMERAMAQLAKEIRSTMPSALAENRSRWVAPRSTPGVNLSRPETPPQLSRETVTATVPVVNDCGIGASIGSGNGSRPASPGAAARQHWTRFESAAAGDTLSRPGSGAMPIPRAAASAPGSDYQPPAPTTQGNTITEWSDRLHSFRASRGV